ncbi:MAG: F0F1 ATP synthase subunit epsilon [Saprospirales bacterium]|nr:F0F1 ATP synthase subunit epsilon [Saprospirales bacterium]
MTITVLTPEKEIFRGPITSVKVPGSKGQFQVLNNHAAIVSSLDAGEVTIVTSKGEYQYYDIESGTIKTSSEPGKVIIFRITKGFIEVLNNEISLLIQGFK